MLLCVATAVAAPRFIPTNQAEGAHQSWMLGPWQKSTTPVLEPNSDEQAVDSRNVYNMAVVRENGLVRMIYRAESLREPAKSMTGRLCLAESQDGLDFQRLPNNEAPEPILVPSEDYEKMGVEDPRLVKIDGTYYLTYSAWDGKTARLCLATAKDMRGPWKKHGPLFPDWGWTKSGAILPEKMSDGPFKGRYVMFFGDTDIWLATSTDLISWQPLKEPVFRPRPGKFDNVLVEPGPPALRTEQGILLIYNGAGRFSESGEQLIYASGQILLDGSDPTKVLERSEEPFLTVTQDWEREGYVDHVVFAEALVPMDDHWLLYYGGADRVIGVARTPR